jgi:hypothetical protein
LSISDQVSAIHITPARHSRAAARQHQLEQGEDQQRADQHQGVEQQQWW